MGVLTATVDDMSGLRSCRYGSVICCFRHSIVGVGEDRNSVQVDVAGMVRWGSTTKSGGRFRGVDGKTTTEWEFSDSYCTRSTDPGCTRQSLTTVKVPEIA